MALTIITYTIIEFLIIKFQRLQKLFFNKVNIISAKKIKRKYVKIDSKINTITVYIKSRKSSISLT